MNKFLFSTQPAICKHWFDVKQSCYLQIQNTLTHQKTNHLVGHIGSLEAAKLTYFPLSSNMEVRPGLIKDVLNENIQQGWAYILRSEQMRLRPQEERLRHVESFYM